MSPPLANSAQARGAAYLLQPITDLRTAEKTGPMVITRGKGVRVWDDQGRDFIETMAGLWCASLGFENERLVGAATAQLRKLPYYHAFSAKANEPLIELAERLVRMAPVPMSKVFFANSGSEANDSAVKMIWYYNNAMGRPKKKKIISRIKGYHGVTVASGSLTGLPNYHRAFDLPIAGILHTDCPHYYRFGKPGESEEQFASRCAESLEALILKEGPDTIAAFFAEPVMGAGGAIPPPRTYFDKIQPILQKYDILFVADEVICGFGRTGNMWGSQTYDLKPDIITCAKALSSAYLPISAVMVNDRVFQPMADQSHEIGMFSHGFTYSGHPVPAAVAVETLKIYEETNILDHVRRIGPHMQEGLRRRFANHHLVGEVRGVGMVAAVELVKNKETKEPFDAKEKIGARLVKCCEAQGLICRALVDTIAFSPPLVITETETDEMLDRFAGALDDLSNQLRRDRISIVVG
ncbi:MAG: aspartate aminotransferase family protein [Alphaproteobacteria bacterium]|nr:aspartate aminotransferase family protein [Alphaproteobacteria bacterium]